MSEGGFSMLVDRRCGPLGAMRRTRRRRGPYRHRGEVCSMCQHFLGKTVEATWVMTTEAHREPLCAPHRIGVELAGLEDPGDQGEIEELRFEPLTQRR